MHRQEPPCSEHGRWLARSVTVGVVVLVLALQADQAAAQNEAMPPPATGQESAAQPEEGAGARGVPFVIEPAQDGAPQAEADPSGASSAQTEELASTVEDEPSNGPNDGNAGGPEPRVDGEDAGGGVEDNGEAGGEEDREEDEDNDQENQDGEGTQAEADQAARIEQAPPDIAGRARFEAPVLPGGHVARLFVSRPYTAFVGLSGRDEPTITAAIDWTPAAAKPVTPQGPAEPADEAVGQDLREAEPPPSEDEAGIVSEEPQPLPIIAVFADPGTPNRTIVDIAVPTPPNRPWYWLRTSAHVMVRGTVLEEHGEDGDGADTVLVERTLYSHIHDVSNPWPARIISAAVAVVVYPGTALLVWQFKRRRYRKDRNLPRPKGLKDPGAFWPTLDPVQLTADQWGRASLSKLQVFFFTLIIFGLLLYIQLRSGFLSGLSADVLYLLGISATGSVAGKFTARLHRRLGFENWSWLRIKGWLPPEEDETRLRNDRPGADKKDEADKKVGDRHQRAKWRDLINDGNEFDVYRFQMLIFSLIVGFALLSAGLTELANLTIPQEMLALLGLSQVVYIGGKAIEPNSWAELDQKISSLRQIESEYRRFHAENNITEAQKKRQEFKAAASEAIDMFQVLYDLRLPKGAVRGATLQPPEEAGEVATPRTDDAGA